MISKNDFYSLIVNYKEEPNQNVKIIHYFYREFKSQSYFNKFDYKNI